MRPVRYLLMAGILLASVLASADPITYTGQAMVSGTLGSVSFTNQLLTITLTSDTSFVYEDSAINTFYNDASPAHLMYFTIGNLPQYYFTDQMSVDDQLDNGWVGFHDYTQANLGGVMVTFNDVFKAYSLTSSLGPITGHNQVNTDVYFATSAGGLNITDYGDSTFTAEVVATPEPSSLLLIGIGVLGVLATVRRKICP